MPAAALWWRLAGTLAPPSLDRADTTLRPAWTAALHALFGTVVAEAIITDHAWPSLVAAVAASDWPRLICSPPLPNTCTTSTPSTRCAPTNTRAC